MARNIFRNYDNDPNETWYRKAGRAIGGAGRAVGHFFAPYKQDIILGSAMAAVLSCSIGGTIYLVSDHSNNKEYHFYGRIGSDTVEFRESYSGGTNYLGVTREDGTFILFTDSNDDLKLEKMSIETCHVVKPAQGDLSEVKQCNEAIYSVESGNPLSQQIVKDNQAVFDSYLEKILAQYLGPAGLDK
jgi:hypothetical protein